MSTPSPEKDTLFEPTVQEKIAYQIFKMEGFFGTPFKTYASVIIKYPNTDHLQTAQPSLPSLPCYQFLSCKNYPRKMVYHPAVQKPKIVKMRQF